MMKENHRMRRWMRLLSVLLGSGILLLAVLALLSAARPALAQESGNCCVQSFMPGATCTANDVRIEEVVFITHTNTCDQEPVGTMTVTLEALVSADGSPDRYDIGLYVALAGNTSALTGTNCYHDYLSPPVTTTPTYGDFNSDTIPDIYDGDWWDGDSDQCGDMESDTQVFRIMESLTLDCQDLDQDPQGAADMSVCASWDNNANTTCSEVQEAIPGTGSKCSCEIVNFDFTPAAVGVSGVAFTPDRGSVSVPLAALVFLGLGTFAGWRGRRAKRG
jgi:hypothetical protein